MNLATFHDEVTVLFCDIKASELSDASLSSRAVAPPHVLLPA
jgi:hypothetical protein